MLEIRKPRSGAEWEEFFEMRYDLLHKYIGIPKGDAKIEKNRLVLIAVDGKKIVGTGSLTVEGKKGHIHYVAVKRTARGKKVGSKIVKKLEQMASKKNLKNLYLNSRKPAKKFYKVLGYEVKGDYFKHKKIGTLHIRMEKIL